jgi:hypothetical protein
MRKPKPNEKRKPNAVGASTWAGGCELRLVRHLGYMLLQVPVAFKRHPSTHGFARSDPSSFKRHMTRHFDDEQVWRRHGQVEASCDASGTSGTCCCRCLSLLNGIHRPTASHEVKMSKITKFEEKQVWRRHGRAGASCDASGTSGTCCCRCLPLLNGIHRPMASHEAIKMSKITKFEEKHV